MQSTSDSIALNNFTGKFAFQPTEIYEAFDNECAIEELLLSIAIYTYTEIINWSSEADPIIDDQFRQRVDANEG